MKLKSLALLLLTIANITSLHKESQTSIQTAIELEENGIYLSHLCYLYSRFLVKSILHTKLFLTRIYAERKSTVMCRLDIQWDVGRKIFLHKLQHHLRCNTNWICPTSQCWGVQSYQKWVQPSEECAWAVDFCDSDPWCLSYVGRCSSCLTSSHWNVFCKCFNKLWPYLSM